MQERLTNYASGRAKVQAVGTDDTLPAVSTKLSGNYTVDLEPPRQRPRNKGYNENHKRFNEQKAVNQQKASAVGARKEVVNIKVMMGFMKTSKATIILTPIEVSNLKSTAHS